MIQALLVTICLAVFPYQGSSIILESGNVNDYEVVYPQNVPALPKGGLQNAEPEFKKARTKFWATKDDCDLAESCTGQTAECPTDQFQRDGQPCENNQGYCYNGKCPTMTNQCIDFFGPGATVSPDTCFQHNLGGTDYSNCRSGNGVNIPCAPADVKCGRLYCRKASDRQPGICNFRYSDDDPDYGMVEPGTKCGDGKVCSNGQCVDIQTAN